MIASRTGTRLSSVWRDHLSSQTKQDAQIQLLRHTNGLCTCYYWAYVSYYCDYCAFLSSILHHTIFLMDKANIRNAREAYFYCIRAETVSVRALLFELLAAVAPGGWGVRVAS
jgi:hypothetical protein